MNFAVRRSLGKLDAIPHDAGKANFQSISVRPDGLDLDGLPRRDGNDHDWLRGKVEGNAEHVGIFDIEESFLVQVVRLAAQSASDDLFAEKLRSEGAHAEHVGDGVGVPPLGEHGDRDDAANIAAEPALLADRIHDLPEDQHIVDLFGLYLLAAALDHLSPELFEFRSCGIAKASSRGSPDSSCSLSIRSVRGRG